MNSQYGYVRVLTCIAAFYYIWEHRNQVMHNECKLEPKKVLAKIKECVNQHIEQTQFNYRDSRIEQIWIEAAGYRLKQPPIKKKVWVRWTPPRAGIKLNFDGSCKKGRMSVGGVFRDHTGNISLTYSRAYDNKDGTALHAEALALETGLQLARQFKINIAAVEGDALSLINALDNSQFDWKCYDTMISCKRMLGNQKVQYINRLCNGVADALAKEGKEFRIDKMVSGAVKRAWNVDQKGFGFF